MNKIAKQKQYKVGDIVCVISRKCTEKIQPHIKRGGLFVVKGIETLKTGSTCLICNRRGCEKSEYRINEDRFDFQKVTEKNIEDANKALVLKYRSQLQAAKEAEKKQKEREKWVKFKEECKESFEKIKKTFTFEEHMKISYTPIVVAELAFIYAFKCRQYCVDHRIEETKKLGRALQEVRRRYDEFILRDLNSRHYEDVKRRAAEFLEEDLLRNTLLKARFQLANEFYKQYNNEVSLLDLRVMCVIGMMMIKAYSKHNRKMTALLRLKLKDRKITDSSLDNQFIVKHLYMVFDAYIGDYELKETDGINLIQRIIDKAVGECRFNIEEGTRILNFKECTTLQR